MYKLLLEFVRSVVILYPSLYLYLRSLTCHAAPHNLVTGVVTVTASCDTVVSRRVADGSDVLRRPWLSRQGEMAELRGVILCRVARKLFPMIYTYKPV